MSHLRLTIVFAISWMLGVSVSHASNEFQPSSWGKGLHLFAGGGPSSSLFESTVESRDLGVGVHLKADLSYVLNESWAIEWSSGVDFNKVDAWLSWNTLFSLGLKYRIPKDLIFGTTSSYAKAFIGRAPAVIFLNGSLPTGETLEGVDRIQFDGLVHGLTFGAYHQTNSGLVWFHEITGTIQTLESFDAIRMDGEVPVVVSHESFHENGMIYGVFLTLGALVF